MKRMASAVAIAIAVSLGTAGSAHADSTELRAQCRESTFRWEHPNLCRPYYGGGANLPGQHRNGPGGGIVRRIIGGLTGGLL